MGAHEKGQPQDVEPLLVVESGDLIPRTRRERKPKTNKNETITNLHSGPVAAQLHFGF